MDNANSNGCPKNNQTMTDNIAIVMTTGTKIPLILSANFAIGAFELLASSTNVIIWEMVVFSPTFFAWNLKKPDTFKVAPITVSPTCLSTGILSPVNALWSREPYPSTITPSTGTFEPLRTTKISPTTTSFTGISISFPSRSTIAVFGARSRSLESASFVFPLERVSKYFPNVINVRIVPADSKYKSIAYRCTNSICPCPKPYPMR